MRDIVRRILSYRNWKDRNNVMMATTAFADRIIGRGVFGLNTYRIGLDLDRGVVHGQKIGDNSYAVSKELFHKNNQPISLITAYHEVAHIIYDKFALAVSPSNFRSLLGGTIINLSESDRSKYTNLVLQCEGDPKQLSKEDKALLNSLEDATNKCMNILGRVYYYQPQEIRARAWANATMERFLTLANEECEDGMLDSVQMDNLARIQRGFKYHILEEKDQESIKKIPSKEEVIWFKKQMDMAKDKYYEMLPEYMEMPKFLRLMTSSMQSVEEPISFMTEYLIMYYDKGLADDFVRMLLDAGDDESLYRISDLLVYTPHELDPDDEKRFKEVIADIDDLSDIEGLNAWECIQMHKAENMAQFCNSDILDPAKYDEAVARLLSIPNMPNKSQIRIVNDSEPVSY